MTTGPSWERDYDERDNDNSWSKTYERGNRTDRDVYPDHGDHYWEYNYKGGTTYREYDDGTVEKTSGGK
jgi:hypothetical protein